MWLMGAAAVTAVALVFFVAFAEKALAGFSHHDLEQLAKSRRNESRAAEIFRDHDKAAEAAACLKYLCIACAALALHNFIAVVMSDFPEGRRLQAQWSWTLAATLGLWVSAVWTPRAAAELWAEPFVLSTWPMWQAAKRVYSLIGWAPTVIRGVLYRMAGRQQTNRQQEELEDEIRTIVAAGRQEGLLEDDAREMIEGVFDLADADVVEIMTPRTDMDMLQNESPWDDVLEVVLKTEHSRLPVFGQNRDDVIGVLHIRDVLPVLVGKAEPPTDGLEPLLRPPFFVPESKPLDDLLEDFQQQRQHLAIVLDEYGGVSGLVTIEDVLEEIVGEIEDEYDENAEQEVKRLPDGSLDVLARTHVDELNEEFDLRFPEDEDYETIGGYVFSSLGRIPRVRDVVEAPGCKITVLETTRRSVVRVRLDLTEADRENESRSA